MTIFETVKAEQLTARKARDSIATAVLTTVLGEIERKVDPGKTPTEQQVFSIITAMRDSVASNEQLQGPTDKSQGELAALNKLLALKPHEASAEEVTAYVDQLIAADSSIAIGQIMGKLKAEFGMRLNGGAASAIVKQALTR